MRFCNTIGPKVPADHYCIPPLERLNLDEVLELVRNKQYFVLHAPRQTGKTSTLRALRDLLNSGAQGEYRCVYANVEAGQASREDAVRAMLTELAIWARATLGDESLATLWPGVLEESGPGDPLRQVLSRFRPGRRQVGGQGIPPPRVNLRRRRHSCVGHVMHRFPGKNGRRQTTHCFIIDPRASHAREADRGAGAGGYRRPRSTKETHSPSRTCSTAPVG